METITFGLVLKYAGLGLLGFLALAAFWNCWLIVEQQSVSVIQRLGKFARIAQPGFNLKIPFIEGVAGRLNLRVMQLDVKVETKTLDNVFVHALVSVQYHVLSGKENEAFYRLNDPKRQIEAYVYDVVRAQVPRLKLDEVFEKKDDVAKAVKDELAQQMDDFGYVIIKALVTDIDPDARVKEAMNDINAAQRKRMAAEELAEADRIIKVKNAQAEAESKALQGKGIADQRKAIVDGLRDSVGDLKDAIPGASAESVMQMILMTQYFDTLKEIGGSGGSTIFLPHSPGGMSDIGEQVRNAVLAANHAAPPGGNGTHKPAAPKSA